MNNFDEGTDYSQTAGDNPTKRLLMNKDELFSLYETHDDEALDQFLLRVLPGPGVTDNKVKKFFLSLGYQMTPRGLHKVREVPFDRKRDFIQNWLMAGLGLGMGGTRREGIEAIANCITEDVQYRPTLKDEINAINKMVMEYGKRNWKNVPGTWSKEIQYTPEGFVDMEGEPVHSLIDQIGLPPETDEIVIEFHSSGYYDQGSMYGGADHMGSAPEGEDDRVPSEIYAVAGSSGVHGVKPHKIELPPEIQHKLWDLFQNDVHAQEMHHDDSDSYEGW